VVNECGPKATINQRNIPICSFSFPFCIINKNRPVGHMLIFDVERFINVTHKINPALEFILCLSAKKRGKEWEKWLGWLD